MLDKLQQVEERFEFVNEQICDPDIVSDMDKYRELMQEVKRLTPIVEKFREYKTAERNFEEAKMIIDDSEADKEFREMAQLEYEESREAMETTTQELKVLLLPRDPIDEILFLLVIV